MNSNFWKNKKVLVTGHTGFKGSWLSLWLNKCGANVTGYALSPIDEHNLFEDAGVAEDMTSITGDIRDLESLKSTIETHKPEIIIHMAAQALVRYSYDHPVETYATNVMGTVNVLEAIRMTNCTRVAIIITSDKCYENKEWIWGYRENDAMGGHDPYSSSKGCAELVTSAYRDSFYSAEKYSIHGVALSSTRAGNVIGGGDWSEDRLVPDIMRAFMNNTPVIIRNPASIRPWQHVMEPLSGYLSLAEKMWDDGKLYSQGWNFGPNEDDAKPVSKIVEHLISLWGEGARSELDSSDQPHEANYLKLDCSKAKSLLKWTPRLNLISALEWTTEYYRHHHQHGNIKELIMQQIDKYENLAQ